jgi:hypothetical protein
MGPFLWIDEFVKFDVVVELYGIGSIHKEWKKKHHNLLNKIIKNKPAIIALWGSIIRSVIDVVRNEPKRVKDVPFWEYSTVTLHSRSRFCFRSRQIWNAQPTAWLKRSPYLIYKNSFFLFLIK